MHFRQSAVASSLLLSFAALSGCGSGVPIDTAACTLQPDPGPCKALLPRYYLDPVSHGCREFIWGGCDGAVPFETLESCRLSCGG